MDTAEYKITDGPNREDVIANFADMGRTPYRRQLSFTVEGNSFFNFDTVSLKHSDWDGCSFVIKGVATEYSAVLRDFLDGQILELLFDTKSRTGIVRRANI